MPSRPLLPALLLLVGSAVLPGASAQEDVPAPDPLATGSAPLALTVRPSRFDDEGAAARARQERLERRMRQNEFLFRSICIHCGPGERHSSNAPFDPAQALGGR